MVIIITSSDWLHTGSQKWSSIRWWWRWNQLAIHKLSGKYASYYYWCWCCTKNSPHCNFVFHSYNSALHTHNQRRCCTSLNDLFRPISTIVNGQFWGSVNQPFNLFCGPSILYHCTITAIDIVLLLTAHTNIPTLKLSIYICIFSNTYL